MKRFEGKVVLVIGGGVGMGRGIAESFADEGATLVISEITQDLGRDAVEAIRARGNSVHQLQCDISRRAEVKAMIDEAARLAGGIDILVLTAAAAPNGRIAEMPDEQYDQLVQCNLSAPFWIAKDAVPYLSQARDKGRLIYISSNAANRCYVPGLVVYGASKAYMNALVRGMAVEFGPLNILANCVEPGMTATDRMKATLPMDVANEMARSFPVPRVGQPEDIANAVKFLASNEASYITGTSLLVDGGVSMVPLTGLTTNMKH